MEGRREGRQRGKRARKREGQKKRGCLHVSPAPKADKQAGGGVKWDDRCWVYKQYHLMREESEGGRRHEILCDVRQRVGVAFDRGKEGSKN